VSGGGTRLVWGELGTEYEDDDETSELVRQQIF
jgi:hypothetical protein